MFNLKSIYFYFLALQISLINFIKKIYFSTNYYNKSLLSRTPQQFYFHPNPFLLSSITNYKKYSFKISEIDPNIFWIKQKNLDGEKNRHSFLWLNLMDRKNAGKSLQKIINIWMTKHSKYKKKIWDSSVLSKRIISWILNVDIILNNGLFEFKKKFLDSIISQSNHLKKGCASFPLTLVIVVIGSVNEKLVSQKFLTLLLSLIFYFFHLILISIFNNHHLYFVSSFLYF